MTTLNDSQISDLNVKTSKYINTLLELVEKNSYLSAKTQEELLKKTIVGLVPENITDSLDKEKIKSYILEIKTIGGYSNINDHSDENITNAKETLEKCVLDICDNFYNNQILGNVLDTVKKRFPTLMSAPNNSQIIAKFIDHARDKFIIAFKDPKISNLLEDNGTFGDTKDNSLKPIQQARADIHNAILKSITDKGREVINDKDIKDLTKIIAGETFHQLHNVMIATDKVIRGTMNGYLAETKYAQIKNNDYTSIEIDPDKLGGESIKSTFVVDIINQLKNSETPIDVLQTKMNDLLKILNNAKNKNKDFFSDEHLLDLSKAVSAIEKKFVKEPKANSSLKAGAAILVAALGFVSSNSAEVGKDDVNTPTKFVLAVAIPMVSAFLIHTLRDNPANKKISDVLTQVDEIKDLLSDHASLKKVLYESANNLAGKFMTDSIKGELGQAAKLFTTMIKNSRSREEQVMSMV